MKKSLGQVFTPKWLVDRVLDKIGYKLDNPDNPSIWGKVIMDTSCGDGSFLVEAVKRLYDVSQYVMYRQQISYREAMKVLFSSVYGFEIDPEHHERCIERLWKAVGAGENDRYTSPHNYHFLRDEFQWNVFCDDAFNHITKEDAISVDYMVINPPYVITRNKDGNNKGLCREVYAEFLEHSYNMSVRKGGKMAAIVPWSWVAIHNTKRFREMLVEDGSLRTLYDFECERVFPNKDVVVNVLFMDGKTKSYIFEHPFKMYSEEEEEEEKDDDYCPKLDIRDVVRRKSYYTMNNLDEILNSHNSNIMVGCGLQTGCDRVFIDNENIPVEYTIPAIKASKGKTVRLFYPYDVNGNVQPLDEGLERMLDNLPEEQRQALKNINRKKCATDYEFGRPNGIKHTYTDRAYLSIYVKDKWSLYLDKLPAGTAVIEGIWIISSYPFSKIEEYLRSDEFIEFALCVGNIKNNYWRVIKKQHVECFLAYCFNNEEKNKDRTE